MNEILEYVTTVKDESTVERLRGVVDDLARGNAKAKAGYKADAVIMGSFRKGRRHGVDIAPTVTSPPGSRDLFSAPHARIMSRSESATDDTLRLVDALNVCIIVTTCSDVGRQAAIHLKLEQIFSDFSRPEDTAHSTSI